MAVVDAARKAVIAIKKALPKKMAVRPTAATPDSESHAGASMEVAAESTTTPGEQSAMDLSTEHSELEPALDRDQVNELLLPLSKDLDASLASASQAALSAWREASRKKIITGRGTRQAEASSARGALQRSVRRVVVEGSVARGFQGSATLNLE